MNQIKNLAQKYKDYSVSLRREFHRYPEPSMEEKRTSKRVIEELEKIGLEGKRIAGTGVVCYIEGIGKGKTIALRADMDALELQEENEEIEYKSKKEGLMHGCGHDGHTAGLLSAAKIFNEMKDKFAGTIKLIFQPGEEIAAGAKKMVEEGVLDDVDAVFGIHLWNELELGKISVEAGPRMAAVNSFKITVTGKGGHGANPHQGIDPIVAGSAIVLDLQSIVSRELNPLNSAVLSVDIFKSGTRFNVLPEEAHLEGTTRCFSKEVNDNFPEIIRRIAKETAASYRAEADLEYDKLTLPLINDPYMAEIGKKSIKNLFGEESLTHLEKTTGGEDFSFFANKVPAAFAFVGSKNEDKLDYYPHHNSRFNIDEDSLEIASALYVQFALNFLKDKQS